MAAMGSSSSSAAMLVGIWVPLLWIAIASAESSQACPLTISPNEIDSTYRYNYSSSQFQSVFADLNQTIQGFTSNHRIKSYAVSVVHGNRTIFKAGLTSTKFRIASVTKVITALGAFILRDRGALSIDDAVGTHLPGFSIINPYDDHEVTLRELMGHVAGVPRDLCNLEKVVCGENETDILRQVAEMRLIRPPWSNEAAYSNLGISLLGHAWEKATQPKMTWEEFVMEEILKPLGMSNSGIELDGVELAPNSNPYARVDLQWSRPAAQMYSTVEDLAKFLKFLITGEPKLVSESSIREWISPAVIFNDGNAGFAFPWELRRIPDHTEMVVSKSGAIFSYQSQILFDPPSQVGVSVLAVFEPGATSSADALADTVFLPVVKAVQTANADFLAAKYAGTYTSRGTAFTFAPTLDFKVKIISGTIRVYVNGSLGLLADAEISVMNDVVPVFVNSTWSLLLKNKTENSFWFSEAPSCAAFAGAISGGPDLVHPNEPGTLYTNVIRFDTEKGVIHWPAVGGRFSKDGSSGRLLHPPGYWLLIVLIVVLNLITPAHLAYSLVEPF